MRVAPVRMIVLVLEYNHNHNHNHNLNHNHSHNTNIPKRGGTNINMTTHHTRLASTHTNHTAMMIQACQSPTHSSSTRMATHPTLIITIMRNICPITINTTPTPPQPPTT